MAMVIVTKLSASGQLMIMNCPILIGQNAAAPKANHTATCVLLTFPTNTTVRHASGKIKDTNIMLQLIT